jgi:hypothetical protein
MTHNLEIQVQDHAREFVRERFRRDPSSSYVLIFGALLARFEWRGKGFSSVATGFRCGQPFGVTLTCAHTSRGRAHLFSEKADRIFFENS